MSTFDENALMRSKKAIEPFKMKKELQYKICE